MAIIKGLLTRKTSLLALSLSSLMIFILLISWGSYRFFLDNKISQLAWDESEVLSRGTMVFSREIGHIKRVTLLLRNSIHTHLAPHSPIAPNGPQDDAISSDSWQDHVVEGFSHFARTSDLISQVRWIMPNGQELIRINYQAGVISRVPKEQLQDKSDRDYVKNSPTGEDNDVYISSLDLNIENKEIVRPFQPTIRGVVKINGSVPGILVVNYDLSKLFDLFRGFSGNGIEAEIVDDNGYWILATEKRLEWGGLLHPNNSSFTFNAHYPVIWQAMTSSNGLERVFDDDHLWSFIKLNLDGSVSDGHLSGRTSSLYFVAHSNKGVFSTWKTTLVLVIACIAIITFTLIAWLIWRQVSAQFETYRLLKFVQQEKMQTEQMNHKLNVTNKRLVDLQDELVEASKLSSLGLMVAGLAHEMHTPLGGVRMALSSCKMWLDKEVKLNPSEGIERMDDSLAIADKNLTRALDVISSFKRIISDRTAQEAQAFYFHNVVNDILFTYKPIFKKHPHIHVNVECPEDIEMLGYPGVLSQVIQNLIDNALDHGFQRLDKGAIKLIAEKQNEKLVFVVEDNGQGIPSEAQKHIFEPFFTSGRSNQHTGLGLHLISQWVNTLMKGRIELSSEQGVGSCFRLTIPLRVDMDLPV